MKDAFGWSKEARVAFELPKKAISTISALAMPDFSKQYVVERTHQVEDWGCPYARREVVGIY